MFISRLKLQGFKSFLDKTNLQFGEGITAVVGPNGCGKSNIVDSIRWVLGEQKTSLLRSDKMEDVIFNGTKNKKPLSLCEASMLIHNNNGVLPIEYTNVEIMRRLYRSGDSEYFINKTQCRLKDINDLFIDTGMNSNAYSVIELKMIDAILSSNKTERRQLFEEAAGINHYKRQRISAERKIKSTQNDMDRINDIIIEVNGNLKNINTQLQKYKRYELLIEEQKRLNFEFSSSEIQLIQEKQKPILENLHKINNQLKNESGQMNLDEDLIIKLQNDCDFNKLKLEESHESIDIKEQKISTINNSTVVLSQKIIANNNQSKHFKDDIATSKINSEDLINKVSNLRAEILKLQPDIKKRNKLFLNCQANINNLNAEYNDLLSKQNNFNIENQNHILEIKNQEQILDRLTHRIQKAGVDINDIQLKINSTENEKNNIQAELNLIRSNLNKTEKLNSNTLININLNKEKHTKSESQIIKYKKMINEYELELNSINSSIDLYKDFIKNNDDIKKEINSIISKKSKSVYGFLHDLLEIDKKYEASLEVALDDYKNYLIVDKISDAKKILSKYNKTISIIALEGLIDKKIKYNSKYNTLISIIKCDKKINPLLKLLLGNIYILDNEAIYKNKDFGKFEWVTLDGKYYNKNIIYKTYSIRDNLKIGQKNRLEKFNKKIINLSSKLDHVNDQLKCEIKDANLYSDQINLESNKLDEIISKLNNLDKESEKQQFILSHKNKLIDDYKLKLREYQSIITDTNNEIITIKDNIEKLNNLHRIHKEKVSNSINLLNQKKLEKTKLQDLLQTYKISLMKAEKEVEGIGERINLLTYQEQEIKGRINKYSRELERIFKENKEFEELLNKNKVQLVELKQTLDIAIKEKFKFQKKYNSSYEELQRLQFELRKNQKSKEEYFAKKRDYEIIIQNNNNKIENHKLKIIELCGDEKPYDFTYDESYDRNVYESKLKNIKKKLDKIGPINYAAYDDFESENERSIFLTDQFNDLKKSKKIIEETILKLDQDAKEKFLNIFTLVQSNFEITYSSFFNGGKGYLRLSNNDDPLESDIEIIAQPPGKKTQTIKMLSAGEKALTSIALLFAIYLVKPSPFCILDEVDAPLDDVNIYKFIDALKSFSNKTQFIVVTHNKITMKRADYIYGVTQEEKGISKIVSVKLNQQDLN